MTMSKVILLLSIAITSTTLLSLVNGRDITSLKVSSANNLFGLQLLNQLSDDKNNVFLSPFSISTALSMLYSGAKGVTAQEMRQVLAYGLANLTDQEVKEQYRSVTKQIDGLQTTKYELNDANKMVVQKDFEILKSYQDDLVNYFQSSVESVDFAKETQKAIDSINSWVSRQTHNKIEKLVETLDPNTVLVLLNAIYFKGLFQYMFLKNETKEDLFFTAENKQTSTQFMRRHGEFNYTEVPELESQLLEIPYSGDDISLYILLPNQRQGLKTLRKRLTDLSVLDKSIAALTNETVFVFLPKFKVETKYSLPQTLSQLGMKSIFTGSADLSGIDGKQDLYVSDVIHKAYIEVSEEGTEAAAAAGVVIDRNAILEFRADHPFLFFIRNNVNGMVLFSGHINQI